MSGSTSYAVNARLQVTGNAQQALRDVAAALSRISRRVPQIETDVNRLIARFATLGMAGTTGLTTLNAAAATLRGTMLQLGLSGNILGRAFTSMGSGITNAMNPAAAAIKATGTAASGANRSASALAGNVGRLATNAQNATTAMQRLSQVPPPRNIPPQARLTGGGGGGGGRGAGLHSTLSEAAGTSMVGAEAGRVVGGFLEAGGERVESAAFIRARQRTPEEQARIRGAAEDITRQVPGTTTAMVMTGISDMLGTLPDLETAIQATRSLMQASLIAHVQTGKPMEQMTDLLTQIIANRAAWMSDEGKLTPEKGLEEMRMLIGSMLGIGSRFNPAEMLNFSKQIGPAGKTLSAEAMYGFVPSLVATDRGYRVATAMAGFHRQFVQGTMSKETAKMMRRYGFFARNAQETAVSPEEAAQMVARGEIHEGEDVENLVRIDPKQFSPAMIKGLNLLATNPFLGFERVIRPILRANGIRDPMTESRVLAQLGTTSTVDRFLTDMQNMPAILLDFVNTQRIWQAGQAPINTIMFEGWKSAIAEMQAGFREMQAGIGEGQAGLAVPWMHELGKGLRSVGDAAKMHPELTAWLMGLGVAIMGLGLAGAGFAVGSLAISGLGAMGTGIVALGAAIGPVGWALIFAALVGGLVKLGLEMESKDWKALFDNIVNGLSSLGSRIANALGLRSRGSAEAWHGAEPNITGWEAGSGVPNFVPREMPPAPPAIPSPLGPLEQVAPPASWNPPDPRRSSYIPAAPAGEEAVNVSTAVYLDGRQIAEVVSRHQADQAGRATAASNRFDPRRGTWPAESLAGMG